MGNAPLDLDEVCEAVQDIVADGQRASAVLGRIRGMLQKTAAQRTRLDVNRLIHEVWAVVRNQALRRHVAVKLDLAHDLPPLLGDRVQLQQVLLNLLTNGMDAMECVAPECRELVIRSMADERGMVTVAVQDAGGGLQGEATEQLFKPLYTTKPDSIGMGLAICKSIMESHGGRIWASQNAQEGATFQFSLPGVQEGV